MDLIMMQEHESFQEKMFNIQQANEKLDELNHRMNSYFQQQSHVRNQYGHSDAHDQDRQLDARDQELQLDGTQFSNHKRASHEPQAGQQEVFSSLRHQKYGKKVIQTENNMKGRNRDDFKLFPKAKSYRQHDLTPVAHDWSLPEGKEACVEAHQPIETPQTDCHFFPHKPPLNPEKKKTSFNKNKMVRSLETREILLREKISHREQQLKQLQEEIVTENEERVYLYKVNVRLEEQLRYLEQQQLSSQSQKTNKVHWQVKKLESDVQQLKRDIEKKKKERKQLRKEQQTLKDGYQILLNNRREVTRKDLQQLQKSQNKDQQNKQVLMKLMQDLEKLRGMVESKIKDNSRGKRRVIKSYHL